MTFVLLHGAGQTSWYWHLVTPQLVGANQEVLLVDFPVDDDACGLEDYASAALEVIGSRGELVLVAPSMAAFTAPIVATRTDVSQIVLVAPMIPIPGETPGQWWAHTGQAEAARRYALQDGRDPDREFDPVEIFLHDVDPAVVAVSGEHVRAQSDTPFGDPWPLRRWPDVSTKCVLGKRDRLFPLEFELRLVAERLGISADEIDSGHLPALSRPAELATLLLRYVSEQER